MDPLKSSTKKILFLSKGEHSASTRYRAFHYFPSLQNAGWQPSHLSLHNGLTGKIRILRAARQSDVVVILRHGLSFPFLQLLRRFSKKLVFDFDDAVFLKSSGKPSLVRAKRFDNTVSRCDAVWAGNKYLAERAKTINKHVTVLPTAVEISKYSVPVKKPDEFVDLVWIGSSSTAKYLKDSLPALEEAAKHVPQLRLKIIADFSLESKILNTVAIPWSEENEISELVSSHIGIAPMNDTPWSRGKCALKVLQYMASGLPVVSSNIGANSDVIGQDENGLLVSGNQQWVEAILQLAGSSTQRERMGKSGRAHCEQHYSLNAYSQKMLAELDGMIT